MKRSHLFLRLLLATFILAGAGLFWTVPEGPVHGSNNGSEADITFAIAAGSTVDNIANVSQTIDFLDTEFCRDALCRPGNWMAWIVLAPDSSWTIEELTTLREILLTTIGALNEAGFDGRALISGYRFRRYHGEHVEEKSGRIAIVNHKKQEVLLADSALKRLWGFYIYHELGHVIDRQLDSRPRNYFQQMIGSTSGKTADGYWMNEHARLHLGESTADAIALWIVMRYTNNPQPVYWQMPEEIDLEQIATAMEAVMTRASSEQ